MIDSMTLEAASIIQLLTKVSSLEKLTLMGYIAELASIENDLQITIEVKDNDELISSLEYPLPE